MPAGRETIQNVALSGAELSKIIEADFAKLLRNHGLLSAHIAYGRVSYELILRLHVDKAVGTDGTTFTRSRKPSTNEVKIDPDRSAIEPPPLNAPAPSEDSVVVGDKLSREIDSPNLERLRHGLPIPVLVRQQNNSQIAESITYPPRTDLGEGNVTMANDTLAAMSDWKVPVPAPRLAVAVAVAVPAVDVDASMEMAKVQTGPLVGGDTMPLGDDTNVAPTT